MKYFQKLWVKLGVIDFMFFTIGLFSISVKKTLVLAHHCGPAQFLFQSLRPNSDRIVSTLRFLNLKISNYLCPPGKNWPGPARSYMQNWTDSWRCYASLHLGQGGPIQGGVRADALTLGRPIQGGGLTPSP